MRNLSKNLRRNGFIKCFRFHWLFFFGCFLVVFIKNSTFASESKRPIKMSIIANHNAIVIMRSNGVIGNFIGGSKDKNINDNSNISEDEKEMFELFQEEKKKPKNKNTNLEEETEEVEKKPKTYKMNKSKVRKKATAFSYLKDSENFLGFYSISFPDKTSDEIARKALNLWLTRLRIRYSLTNYMWVTERQKNRNLHFHLLTNNKMPIKAVNREMAEILRHYETQKQLSFGNSSFDKYNGVDLSYSGKPRKNSKKKYIYTKQTTIQRQKFISRYITKYISKQDEIWEFLPNHWSRSISVLNHGVKLNLEEEKIAIDLILSPSFDGKIISNDFCMLYLFKDELPRILLKRLLAENERVYSLACNELTKVA